MPGPRTVQVPVSVRSAFELERASAGHRLPAPVRAGGRRPATPARPRLREHEDDHPHRRGRAGRGQRRLRAERDGPAGRQPDRRADAAPPRGAALIPFGSSVPVRARAPGYADRTLNVPITNAAPTTLDPTTTSGAAPSRLQPGSLVGSTATASAPGRGFRSATSWPRPTPTSTRRPRRSASACHAWRPPAPSPSFRPRPRRRTSRQTTSRPALPQLLRLPVQQPRLGQPLLGERRSWSATRRCSSREPVLAALRLHHRAPIPNPIAYLKWQVIEEIVQ